MNYEKIYYNLMKSRKNRVRCKDIYYEKHHILPKCFGGRSCRDNLVYLTYREHFISHKLLFSFSIGENKIKMGYALHRLCTINNGTQKYRIKTSKEFEKIKTRVYEFIQGENHPAFGRKMSKKFGKKISERMKGSGNHRYGKPPWNEGLTKDIDDRVRLYGIKGSKTNTGRKLSESCIKAISKSLRGKNTYPRSKDHREKISKTLTGRKLSKSVCMKMSAARKGIPQRKLTCPHCGKIGGTTMYRWHFDNCKYKEN